MNMDGSNWLPYGGIVVTKGNFTIYRLDAWQPFSKSSINLNNIWMDKNQI